MIDKLIDFINNINTHENENDLKCVRELKAELKEKHDINVFDERGMTLLIYAIIENNVEIAKLLINNGANINASDNVSQTVLMYASMVGTSYSEEIIKLLINMGVNINATDKYGQTALIKACECGKYYIAKLLINNNADINIIDENDMTALLYAKENNYTNIIKLLDKNEV